MRMLTRVAKHVSRDYGNDSNFSFCKLRPDKYDDFQGFLLLLVLFFCAEWQLKRRAAYQECPAEARRTLHLHGADAH